MKQLGRVGAVARGGWRRGRDLPGTVWGALRLYGRGLRLAASSALTTLAVVLLLGLSMQLLPVLQVWLVKLVIDGLATAVRGVGRRQHTVLILAALYAVTLLFPAGTRPLQNLLAARLRDHAMATVDRQLMEAGRRLVDLHRIEQPAFGDELRLLEGSPFFVSDLTDAVARGVGLPLQLGGLLLLLGSLHPSCRWRWWGRPYPACWRRSGSNASGS